MELRADEFTVFERVVYIALNIAGWLWDVVTYIPTYFTADQVTDCDVVQARRIDSNRTSPYRCVQRLGGLITGFKDVQTLGDLFSDTAEKYGNNRCIGTRQLFSEEDEIQPNGRIFKKLILGEYVWLTYREVKHRIQNIGQGLLSVGLKPKQNIIIFAETKAEWMICAQAAFAYNFPLATVYSTLGDESLIHGINEVEASTLIVDVHLLPKLKNIFEQLHFVKTIIYIGEAKKGTITGFPTSTTLLSLAALEEKGAVANPDMLDIQKPKTDDVAVIMYTSGSTGTPKGVLLSHKNLLAACYAASQYVPDFSEHDVYIGYLPLAHILELMAECTVLTQGACIGYSSALTLSDQSSKIKKGSKGDITVLKPTLMTAVPMIMDRIRKNVLEKVKEGPRLMQVLFTFAYFYKLKQLRRGADTPLLNRLLFSKIRAILGGHVRCILSGGAPLSPETEEFMNVCFCCPVGQGFGATETSGVASATEAWDISTGRVGPPIGCSEIKLVSWMEGGYTVHDKPNPRGELVIGGANIALGYYKQDAITQEAFKTENGQRWFYTGDIGVVYSDGCFEIIDRRKDLIKLSAGEYISLSKVESALKQSPYIDNCWVYGVSTESYVIAFVIPNQKHFKDFTEREGLDGSFEALCGHEMVEKEVLASVEQYARFAKLEKYEIPKRIKVCSEQWLPETELVTAAFKLKRKNLERFYLDEINRMYGKK